MLAIPRSLLEDTFRHLRKCGQGRAECQVLWIGPWASPESITAVAHPKHLAHTSGFEIDSFWISSFWKELSNAQVGIRCQVHTHPGRAFHSQTDDDWPVVHTAGFLSLVIPDFARGEICLDRVYLAELQKNGEWQEVRQCARIKVI